MPIPAQNDFLLPFLTLLRDGQALERAQLTYQLTKHFAITPEAAQQMSGNQFTLISRVAWCDIHFVKAGFVHKTQSPHGSDQDTFQITPLGVRELHKRPAQITVGYLQGFYRGNIHRGAGSDDTTSDAELLLYSLLDKLPAPFSVFHSIKWFGRHSGTIGEVDFLIAHPSYGILVLEVKGGDIRLLNGEWKSVDRNGRIHDIHDPCKQADRNRWALHDWLNDQPRTRGLRYAIFPAVAVPNSAAVTDIRPDCPKDIFIDLRHLDDLVGRLTHIFQYWAQRRDERNAHMDGKAAVEALTALLIPTRTLQPALADLFERERRKINELTEQQFRVLRMLRSQRRAAIIGGAGTGKTLLAMEKATQLGGEGYRVLLVCFNKPLADWIGSQLQSANIVVATFHSLVGQAVNWARIQRNTRKSDQFYEEAGEWLADAADMIRSDPALHTLQFDAVIVDEAQDFDETWWIGLLDLLRNPELGVFYVFFDDNQRIYRQISKIPMQAEPLHLDENCRNTQHIYAALAPYTQEQDLVCLGPEGRPVEVIPAKTKPDAKRALQNTLHRLVNEEGIPAKDIVVLTPVAEGRSQWKVNDMLGNFIVTWDMQTEMPLAARISTIQRFKGLEAAVVILTELGQLPDDTRDTLLYIGLSRARNHVIVIGELPTGDVKP
ncbi:MAG: winged helix-turn-helix domain-containing protein [Phototrophicaceae bacterium]|jgi:ATP:corrinoid adenosyltransferase